MSEERYPTYLESLDEIEQLKLKWKALKIFLEKEHKSNEPEEYEKKLYNNDDFIKRHKQIVIEDILAQMKKIEESEVLDLEEIK